VQDATVRHIKALANAKFAKTVLSKAEAAGLAEEMMLLLMLPTECSLGGRCDTAVARGTAGIAAGAALRF
jgi:hypothetical protein